VQLVACIASDPYISFPTNFTISVCTMFLSECYKLQVIQNQDLVGIFYLTGLVSGCGICGGQSSTGARILRFPQPIIPPIGHLHLHAAALVAGTVGQ
jgi:hypothetical protein